MIQRVLKYESFSSFALTQSEHEVAIPSEFKLLKYELSKCTVNTQKRITLSELQNYKLSKRLCGDFSSIFWKKVYNS